MSIHSSLRGADNLEGARSVLTRFERIQKLVKDGKLDETEASAFGLPKVRTKFKVAKAKKAEGEDEGVVGGGVEGAEEGEAGGESPSAGE